MQRFIAVGILLGSYAATSYCSPDPLVGAWALATAEGPSLIASCQGMSLEFTADNHLVRRTGELVYTTVVQKKPEGKGWMLIEKLESQNGEVACNGQPSEKVLMHLQRRAYVEVDGGILRYYKTWNAKQFLKFQRAAHD